MIGAWNAPYTLKDRLILNAAFTGTNKALPVFCPRATRRYPERSNSMACKRKAHGKTGNDFL